MIGGCWNRDNEMIRPSAPPPSCTLGDEGRDNGRKKKRKERDKSGLTIYCTTPEASDCFWVLKERLDEKLVRMGRGITARCPWWFGARLKAKVESKFMPGRTLAVQFREKGAADLPWLERGLVPVEIVTERRTRPLSIGLETRRGGPLKKDDVAERMVLSLFKEKSVGGGEGRGEE